MEQFRQLMTRLMNNEGSLEQAEEWFVQLQELVADDTSEYLPAEGMANLEEVMAVRRRTDTLTQDRNAASQSVYLAATIQKIMDMQIRSDLGQDIDLIEFESCFTILRTSVPGVSWTDLILNREATTTSAEILEQAFNLRIDPHKSVNL